MNDLTNKELRKKYVVGAKDENFTQLNYIEINPNEIDPRSLEKDEGPDSLYLPTTKKIDYYSMAYGSGDTLTLTSEYEQIEIKPMNLPMPDWQRGETEQYKVVSNAFENRAYEKFMSAINTSFQSQINSTTKSEISALQGTKSVLSKELEAIEEYAKTHFLSPSETQKLKDDLIKRNYNLWKDTIKELGQKRDRPPPAQAGAGEAAGTGDIFDGFDVAPRTGISRTNGFLNFKAVDTSQLRAEIEELNPPTGVVNRFFGEETLPIPTPFNFEIGVTGTEFKLIAERFFQGNNTGQNTPFENAVVNMDIKSINSMIMLMVNYENAKDDVDNNEKNKLITSLKNKITNQDANIYFKELIRIVNEISNAIWEKNLINFTVEQMKSYSTKNNAFDLIVDFFIKLGQALFNELNKPIYVYIRGLLRPHKQGKDGNTIQYHTNSTALQIPGINQSTVFFTRVNEGRLINVSRDNDFAPEVREQTIIDEFD